MPLDKTNIERLIEVLHAHAESPQPFSECPDKLCVMVRGELEELRTIRRAERVRGALEEHDAICTDCIVALGPKAYIRCKRGTKLAEQAAIADGKGDEA